MAVAGLPAHADTTHSGLGARAAVTLPSLPNRLAFTTSTPYFENPDGSYSRGAHGIGTIGFDGSDPRVLTNPSGNAFDYGPQWSPDGSWLAFMRRLDQSPSTEVAVIPRDGGNVQVLDQDGFAPTWSPDGRQLAWVSVAADGGESIEIADLDETQSSLSVSGQHALFSLSPEPHINNLQFSPDGRAIAFFEWTQAQPDNGAVFSVSSKGGQPVQLTHGYPAAPYKPLSWSPDGMHLLYEADVDTDPHVEMPRAYLVNADGTHEHPVTQESDQEYDEFAAWLPTGLGVGLISNYDATDIKIVALTGTVLENLAGNQFVDRDGLAFSADGAFAYMVAAPKSQPAWPPAPPDLYAIPLSGAPTIQLTHDQSVWGSTLQAFDPGRALRVIAGDAVDQALALSRELFTSAKSVVICLANSPLAALAASPLAATLHGPLLLVGSSGVTPDIAAELSRLGASDAYLVGPVPQSVADQLTALGVQPHSVSASPNPTQLGGAVATRLDRHSAVIAIRTSGADAWSTPLAAAGFAAARRVPLLYTGAAQLPAATRDALSRTGTTHVTLVAPGDVDPGPLARHLRAAGMTVTVITGNRYAVSAKLAAMAARLDGAPQQLILTAGSDLQPSLTSAAAAGAGGGISLLVPPSGGLNDTAKQVIADTGDDVTRAWIAGGVDEVSPQVETQVERLL